VIKDYPSLCGEVFAWKEKGRNGKFHSVYGASRGDFNSEGTKSRELEGLERLSSQWWEQLDSTGEVVFIQWNIKVKKIKNKVIYVALILLMVIPTISVKILVYVNFAPNLCL